MKHQDPLSALHYQSPRMRPRQQRRTNTISPNNPYQQPRQRQNQYAMNTPQRDRRRPHYKSPTGYAENEDEWNNYSSPHRQSNIQQQQYNTPNNYGYQDIPRYNYHEPTTNTLYWWFNLLCYYPRRIYLSLLRENRPQDVMRILCVLFVILAIVTFLWNMDVTSGCLFWIGMAIICAIGGADQFYASQPNQYNAYQNTNVAHSAFVPSNATNYNTKPLNQTW